MSWLLSPLAWLLLAGLLLPWAWLRHRRWSLLSTICTAAMVASLLAMTAWGANTLTGPLEHPYLGSDGCDTSSPDAPDVAVVLGGGIDAWPRDADDYSVLNLSSRRRVDRAVRWWRERPGRSLLLQGGAPYPR